MFEKRGYGQERTMKLKTQSDELGKDRSWEGLMWKGKIPHPIVLRGSTRACGRAGSGTG